jgi:hypothetical protein
MWLVQHHAAIACAVNFATCNSPTKLCSHKQQHSSLPPGSTCNHAGGIPQLGLVLLLLLLVLLSPGAVLQPVVSVGVCRAPEDADHQRLGLHMGRHIMHVMPYTTDAWGADLTPIAWI